MRLRQRFGERYNESNVVLSATDTMRAPPVASRTTRCTT